MKDNPFKIIEPREEVPAAMKEEVMGTVKSIVFILRFVQLFVGDFTSVFIDKFKTENRNKKP
jgi:hypothetical protein